MIRAVRVVVLGIVAALALAVPAAAQAPGASPCAPGGPSNANNPAASQYPPNQCAAQASKSQAVPGETLTITGQCPQNSSRVDFTLDPGGRSLGSATPSADGTYSAPVTIPLATPLGSHEIVETCVNVLGNSATRTALTVVAAAVAAGTLPRTGSSTLVPSVGAGIGLVLVGGAAVVIARRRRTAAR